MNLQREYLGFNDRWFRVLGIPFVALLVPPVFFNLPFGEAPFFFLGLAHTAAIWEGNRWIFIRGSQKFQSFPQWRQRMYWVLWRSIPFTAVACTGIDMAFQFLPKNSMLAVTPTSLLGSYSASYLLLLAIGAVYESIRFFSLWKRALEEKKVLEQAHLASQLEGLRNQVNPHFLFNSLNTLTWLIQEDPTKASTFVQQLSKVYRYVLESREARLIPLFNEKEFLDAYLYLLKVRFGENFRVSRHNFPDPNSWLIVPLSLQILVENAIKHNEVSAEKPLHLELFGHGSHLVVRNNLQRKQQVQDSTGVGLENIRQRYSMLTDHPVDLLVTATHFSVFLPLIADKQTTDS